MSEPNTILSLKINVKGSNVHSGSDINDALNAICSGIGDFAVLSKVSDCKSYIVTAGQLQSDLYQFLTDMNIQSVKEWHDFNVEKEVEEDEEVEVDQLLLFLFQTYRETTNSEKLSCCQIK
jgi:hypothetical protein